MKIMADAINFTAVINEHNEEKRAVVEELIFYIDGILKDFHTPMKLRNTKRKNRKAVVEAVQELMYPQKEQRKLLPVGVGDGEIFAHLLRVRVPTNCEQTCLKALHIYLKYALTVRTYGTL